MRCLKISLREICVSRFLTPKRVSLSFVSLISSALNFIAKPVFSLIFPIIKSALVRFLTCFSIKFNVCGFDITAGITAI